MRRLRLGSLLLVCGMLGCRQANLDRVQGYVEGEYVYVAAPVAGQLELLAVQRGTQVQSGAPLFALDRVPQQAARDEAGARLAQARASLADAKKGKRPPEIEAIEAQLRQAKAALSFSEREVARQEVLIRTDATATQEFDRARSLRDQDRQRVLQLEAELRTARLGAREDQIVAAEATVRAHEAALAKAEWELGQSRQAAPAAGLVFDTLFRQGEFVPAARPVVALLPPPNIKVRAFVSEKRIGTLKVGAPVRVEVDGVPEALSGSVSFIAPRAEFTPPVIYSQENRAKLVFMIEITFAPHVAAQLHPGQPVDVYLEP